MKENELLIFDFSPTKIFYSDKLLLEHGSEIGIHRALFLDSLMLRTPQNFKLIMSILND